jgi:hypothetical protein
MSSAPWGRKLGRDQFVYQSDRWIGNQAEKRNEAEWTGIARGMDEEKWRRIATPAVSLWAVAVHNSNLLTARRIGSPGKPWARLIPLSRGRMLELGSPEVSGPVMRLKRLVVP